MQKGFKQIDPFRWDESIFKLIGKDWMLIAAGDKKNYNMMTASWGSCGILWNKPISIIFIRPQRYTLEFVERNDFYTLNFFDQSYRDTLNLLGTESGRDFNKMEIKELDALETDNNSVCFEQARIVMECKKIYHDDIKPSMFLDQDIHKMYPGNDYHKMFFGEIISVLKKI